MNSNCCAESVRQDLSRQDLSRMLPSAWEINLLIVGEIDFQSMVVLCMFAQLHLLLCFESQLTLVIKGVQNFFIFLLLS